ncbi:MAG: putative aminoglycoside phosphotransferase [Marmoricola sp.]|nr:putative aminoglycoside phosphotransferase [Marmoricola sp.]
MSGELTPAELAGVASAMASAGTVPSGPLTAEMIAGGRSNLTFRITDGTDRWVLRTGPRVGRTPSAHDVAREFRVTSALAGTAVPVAPAVALVEDEELLGGPFTICGFVSGAAIRTQSDLAAYDAPALSAMLDGLLRALAALHRVDHVAIGLERFGRPDGYAARQLRRWSGQWELVGTAPLDALVAEVVATLGDRLPRQRSTGIVHGDFRADNVLLAGTDVAAVVDWELSTIGDPVADVAMMCAYRAPEFDLIIGEPSSWTSDRLPDVDALAAAYVAVGGVDLVDWEGHLALAYFKVAMIAAGIDHRRRAGAASGPGFDTAGDAVAPYLDLASALLGSS